MVTFPLGALSFTTASPFRSPVMKTSSTTSPEASRLPLPFTEPSRRARSLPVSTTRSPVLRSGMPQCRRAGRSSAPVRSSDPPSSPRRLVAARLSSALRQPPVPAAPCQPSLVRPVREWGAVSHPRASAHVEKSAM